MRKDDEIRFRHMLDAAREAATQISENTRLRLSEIPWQ